MVSLNNSMSKLTMIIVKDNLLNEEARRKKNSVSSSSKAYASKKHMKNVKLELHMAMTKILNGQD